jgi:hypothetical protein
MDSFQKLVFSSSKYGESEINSKQRQKGMKGVENK